MSGLVIREERAADVDAIAAVIHAAFNPHPYSDGSEVGIVAALRRDAVLSLSLVAEQVGEIVGHVAFSPAEVAGQAGWSLLGPVSVRPTLHRRGIGSALIEAGLAQMRADGWRGVVLTGSFVYYRRFGFAAQEGLSWPGVPSQYVQGVSFGEDAPVGRITCHPAFGGDS